MANPFTKLEDLCLLNYYEGWYTGATQDESYIADATEIYFTWLTGLANEYNVNADFDETPDGCQELHNDIEEYLKENITFIDLEEEYEYAEEYIKDRGLIDDNQIDSYDIYEAVDWSEMNYKNIIYEHVIKKFKENKYEVI